jgi:hypothetical protein
LLLTSTQSLYHESPHIGNIKVDILRSFPNPEIKAALLSGEILRFSACFLRAVRCVTLAGTYLEGDKIEIVPEHTDAEIQARVNQTRSFQLDFGHPKFARFALSASAHR